MDELFLEVWKLSQKGYCCSQIMLRLALDIQGVQNPGLAAAMAGLCYGAAQRRGACGVLTGGACLLAYYAGQGEDGQQPEPQLPLMLEQYSDWFHEWAGERFDGVSCAEIAGEDEPDLHVCGEMLVSAFSRIREILAQSGLDLDQPRHE